MGCKTFIIHTVLNFNCVFLLSIPKFIIYYNTILLPVGIGFLSINSHISEPTGGRYDEAYFGCRKYIFERNRVRIKINGGFAG